MEKIAKLLNILTIVMLVVTIVLVGLFFGGGDLPNAQYTTPIYTDQLIWWAYVLFGLSTITAVAFPIYRLFTRPKQAIKSLIALVGLAVVVLIAYSLSDGTLMNLPGYTGPDNNPETLKFSDTILFTMYFLGIAAIGSIIVTEIIRRVR